MNANEGVIEEGGKYYAVENGERYRLPYKTVKEIVFNNVSKQELVDLQHAARLQYKLLLNEAILRAKVEFVKQRISIVYNPPGYNKGKPEISPEGIAALIRQEGVHVDLASAEQRDVDYYAEIWRAQFHPPMIREHPPYGYTLDEWKKMKDKYEQKVKQAREKKLEEFHEWQKRYEQEHPELASR